MKTRFLRSTGLALTLFCAASIAAQNSQVDEREQEWRRYSVPATEFVRQNDSAKTVLFRTPAAWQVEGSGLSFAGPHSSSIKVFVEKISDGIPLRDYVVALTQQLQNQPGAESMLIRRTQMSGMEAREILLQIPDATGTMTRRLIWCAVDGPTAVSVVLITPSSHVGEIEPYFKAVIQSVTILGDARYSAFEQLRAEAIKLSRPSRVDEVQRLTDSLNGLDPEARRSSIARLAGVFASSPDSAIDLIIDRRAMVRAAAVESVVSSKNAALTPILLHALEDQEPFVAEPAARRLAALPHITSLLKKQTVGWFRSESLARVWPFLAPTKRLEILRDIFSAKVQTSPRPIPARRSAPEVPKPALPVIGKVTVTANPPGPKGKLVAGALIDPSIQLGALTLLRDVPIRDFQLPLSQVLAAHSEPLTRTALEVALERHEPLPVAPLLNLLSSSNQSIVSLAIENLEASAKVSDLPLVEARINQVSTKSSGVAVPSSTGSQNSSVGDKLRLAARRIRLREQVASAPSVQARTQIITQTMTDPTMAEWAWLQFGRDDPAPTVLPAVTPSTAGAGQMKVTPLAENLLPANLTLYTALPDPLATFNRLGGAFNSIQMDSAREQADLVLIMSATREQFAQQLNAEPDASVFEYFGIQPTAPAVFASWNAEGAPSGAGGAKRQAVVIRVRDRQRFERLIGLYQKRIGDFARLSEFVGIGSRFLGLLPGVIPMAAQMLLDGKADTSTETTILRMGVAGTTSWNGHPIIFNAQDRIDSSGHVIRDVAYLTYLGDSAVLTADLHSMREVLARAAKSSPNPAPVSHQVKEGADVFYSSNPTELFGNSGKPSEKVSENGVLRIANSVWNNSFHLEFAESDWAKPLIKFQPEELAAPRELLPHATFAYYLMKLDPPLAWATWKGLLGAQESQDLTSIWAVDFEREVLPELGSECGAAVVGVPNIVGKNWEVPMVLFFQLKSDKLARLLEQGALLKNQSQGSRVTRFKLDSGEWFAGVRAGYLVLANSEAALTAVDQKEKLANASDFSKAAKRTPAGVVGFGGLALDAAVTAITDSVSEPDKRRQLSAMLSVAKAFHSQSFYATAEPGRLDARFAALIGREGRYSVAELLKLSREFGLAYAVVEAGGVPISNQERLNSLRLRIRAKAQGEIDRIIADVHLPAQIAEKKSDHEFELTVKPRRATAMPNIKLPVTDPAVAVFLGSTREIRADDPIVVSKAREIVGDDRNAWSVARKLGEWTYQNLKWKRVDYATAAQTLATREADCYEFSQLYVAMARSLGLPARIVSGLAYSGRSFGGHAWVEVYVGQWIELDPTFGTDFVDATHIRDASGGFLTYAALNLVELEVLDAPRGFADFQSNATALAQKLSEELPKHNLSVLTAALDLGLLADELMGQGSWARMTEAERAQMTSAYRRLTTELISGFESTEKNSLRVLQVKENGDRANALMMNSTEFGDQLQKFTFARQNGGWFLAEALQADSGLRIVSDLLSSTIAEITDRRSGKTRRGGTVTPHVRVLLAMNQDSKKALEIADQGLKDNPNDTTLLFVKSLVLSNSERIEDAKVIWTQLSSGPEPMAPAVLNLAEFFNASDKAGDGQRAVEHYEKYTTLEPGDPRGHSALASLYHKLKETNRAEMAYRAALAADPANIEVYLDLAEFLAAQQRYQDAFKATDESMGRTPEKDPLAQLFLRFWLAEPEQLDAGEAIARLIPERMTKNAPVNLYLGRMRLNAGKLKEALVLLQRAAEIDQKSAEAYSAIAECYRRLRDWPAALSAANTALSRDPEDAEAFYNRACAFARLGRTREAMSSLKRAVELGPLFALSLEDEPDLKNLATMREFKKIIADRDKK